jgi:glycosyltransferase involved in cell wall biosynthesis
MGALPSAAQRAELRASRAERTYAAAVKLEWMDHPWADLERAGRWLRWIGDDVRPDVVHLNGYVHATLPWRAPVLVVGHSCVLSWFAAVKGEAAPRPWSRYAAAVRAGLEAADLVVAPTRAMLRELELRYGVIAEREVIPNGRRARPTRAKKEPFVFSAGRLWDEAKNVAALDRVAPALPWPVVVAGALGREGRPRHLRALGQLDRDETDAWLARASIFALPARYEPFGLAALEAALAGAALVLGDIRSLREVWGDAALYVDPEDDDGLAATLTLLIEDPELRTKLAARALVRARTYTPERMADAYLDVYERLRTRAAEPVELAV